LDIDEDRKVEITQALVGLSNRFGISLHCCAQPFEDQISGCDCLGCVDGKILTDLYGGKVTLAKDQSQRKLCKCTRSVDIGSYKEQPCGFKCIYCYANK